MSTQTDNGRAFEWVVGYTLHLLTGLNIEENSFSNMARDAYNSISERQQNIFSLAAKSAINHILKKENINLNNGHSGHILFNSDSAGKNGDVRDVILFINSRSIGFSCKNNHTALKHSRLSGRLDFVKSWGINSLGCSDQYWNEVKPLFAELQNIKKVSNSSYLWAQLDDKAIRFYWPILDAWHNEINRICNISEATCANLCKAIISYLVGNHDFYKIICEGSKSVTIQAWNFNKTLATKQSKYPEFINSINNRNGGQYSKTITFNHGYSINFRIHSASSRVEPSLKFDITASGLPPSEIYQQTLDIVE